ncbi:MAG: efflux system, outer rane lipoprotein NodT family [Phenylobacterium sp.]|nr:efflux system, outer rane lipoprotein NodT family [Phenylobacterium sp.]
MLRRTLVPLLAAAVALSGCTLAPPYVRPGLPVSQSWPEPGPAPGPVMAGDLAWRDVFQDPRLQAVIDLALRQNRDLRVAAGNIEQARAQYRIQRAQLLPAIDAVGSESKVHTPAPVSLTGQSLTLEQYSATVGFSAWEIDLFGRLRSLSAAALQSYFATEETRRAVQISLIAEVAADYLALAADQDLLKVTQDTLKTREDNLALFQKRFDAGAISQLDLRQEETLAEQARSDLAVALAQVGLDRNALTLVVGADVPANLLPDGGLADIRLRTELEPGLPSDVLTRRPDVLAAEHSLQAQNANIGAARAAFFPRISLTGSTGSASTDLNKLFQAGTGAWSWTPQIVLPLFAGGANLANLRGARAGRDIAVAQYEKAIQTAFREVADTLSIRSTIRDRVAAQQRLVAAAADAQRLSQARYDRGVDSYLVLLEAQRTLYLARRTLLTAQLVETVNRVTLYKALGGGSTSGGANGR